MDTKKSCETFKSEVLPFFKGNLEDTMAVYSLFGRACQIQMPHTSVVARFSHELRLAEKGVQDKPSKGLLEFDLELEQVLSKCIVKDQVGCLARIYMDAGENIPGNSLMCLLVTKRDRYWYESAIFLQAVASESSIHPKLAALLGDIDPEAFDQYDFMHIDPNDFLSDRVPADRLNRIISEAKIRLSNRRERAAFSPMLANLASNPNNTIDDSL